MFRGVAKSCSKSLSSVRSYSKTVAVRAAEPTTSELQLLNFSTPYQTIYNKKPVAMVQIPGTEGETGIMLGNVPTIVQLQPGVVTVWEGESSEKYFISGGFAIHHENNVTDITVAEAVPLSDLDETAVKNAYAEALKEEAAATTDIQKATTQIQVETLFEISKVLGVTV